MSNLKPVYWTEKDLKEAIDNLQNLRLTPEEHTAYVMTLSYNAIGIQMEKERMEEFVRETKERIAKETRERVTRTYAIEFLKKGKLFDLDIVEMLGVSTEYILNLKKELNL